MPAPLKKGSQDNPANYRPVCLISHARKIIDFAILPIVNGKFTPTAQQFGFQSGIAVEQAILQVQYNA